MREMYFNEPFIRSNNELLFSVFKMPRNDNDWQIEELVKIVSRPKPKERKVLGIARIIRINEKHVAKKYHYFLAGFSRNEDNTPDVITPEEAREQGFIGLHGGGDLDKFKHYLYKKYGFPYSYGYVINKITLYWLDNSVLKNTNTKE